MLYLFFLYLHCKLSFEWQLGAVWASLGYLFLWGCVAPYQDRESSLHFGVVESTRKRKENGILIVSFPVRVTKMKSVDCHYSPI